ncbi:hypothetical protein BST36_08275 [Mycolicibacterium moriokaense]|uniref:Ferredoxin n=1 Tax=Mycolicibacterium moriokaense TaxID=39691 RepID=A0AAD1M9Q5_9MYCO|nr:PDR/VanB family oxidoreductase [Mycolicibacterium moriokaense]MCV7041973.1 oxidoreductase [Mycolicibacterium moriokaense]ORB25061.1 hypothetical protein BST36_08275 [Mycolicibacterium moriokaense]BBX04740.1 ferredoxin [Mycolicibacterium moriokaense]
MTEFAGDRIDVVVHRRIAEADGVVGLELRHAGGAPLPPWTPGAHVDLILPSGLVRQYSLCGDVTDRGHYRIAVLRDARSRGGSIEIHDTITTQQELQIRGPRNHFALSPAAQYLFIAGGIGITPILPMIRHVESEGIPWTLAYGGRSLSSMAFVDEVRSTRGGSVHIVAQDRCGLLDLDRLFADASPAAEVYCCGPEALLQAVLDRSVADVPARPVHLERFGAAPDANLTDNANHAANHEFIVELKRSGRWLTVPPNRTLLDVVRETNPDVSFSCEEGYCGSCETGVIEGIPDHRDTLLSKEEREAGRSMMICVSRSKTRRLVLDL